MKSLKHLWLFSAVLIGTALYSSDATQKMISASSDADLKMFVLGVGAKYLTDWLVFQGAQHVWGDEPVQSEEAENEDLLSIAKKVGRKSTLKEARNLLQKSLTSYLAHLLRSENVSSSTIDSVTIYLSTGMNIPSALKLLKATHGSVLLLWQMASSTASIGKKISLSAAEGVQISLHSLVNAFKKINPTYRHDFAYPLTFSGATMLSCGPRDPYCLKQEPQHLEVHQDLWSDPEALVLECCDLISQGAVVSTGVALSILAYQLGTCIVPLLMENKFSHMLNPQANALIEKIMRKYVSDSVLHLLRKCIINAINNYHVRERTSHEQVDHELGDLLKSGIKYTANAQATLQASRLIQSLFEDLSLSKSE
jgi:hypothetical protein